MNQCLPAKRSSSASIRIVMSLVLGLWGLLAQGCHVTLRTSAQNDDQLVELLKNQADRWDKAIIRKDLPAIAANMADDFRNIAGDGSVADKAQFLEEIVSPKLEIDPYTVEDFDVRIFGDIALLCGRTNMTGRYEGKPFKSHYRYIDMYVRRDGAWKVVSVQISKIPNAP